MATRALAARPEPTSTRDAILDAAEREFAARGFSGVSMRQIATAAGLKNQASLYHHFRDKQALYAAVLRRGLGPVVELVAEASLHAAAAGASPRSAGDAVLDRLFDYLAEHPHLPRLIQRAGLDDTRALRTTLARFLRPLYEQGLEVLAGAPGRWEPADLPHVAAGIYLLIFGYFANTALLAVVAGQDAESPASVARQRRFLKTAVTRLLGTAPAPRLAPSGRRRM
ncbi:MAG TPA: TetR family transcriptional regulator [Candidatus Binatia bacterium]|jgi:AcrR family transcriptional regulator|nr:TetR family transcriptional regulator [Candidatus Binatia bacterium]